MLLKYPEADGISCFKLFMVVSPEGTLLNKNAYPDILGQFGHQSWERAAFLPTALKNILETWMFQSIQKRAFLLPFSVSVSFSNCVISSVIPFFKSKMLTMLLFFSG